MAKVEKDFEELLRLFNRHKVRYCIVGAFALGFHARPRYTKDLDILVESSLGNGKKILKVLQDFGFGSLRIAAEDFSREGRFIQLGYEPLRVDLITSIEGLKFDEIWKGRKMGTLGSTRVPFIGLKELVKNKKVSGRRQDLADLEILQRALKKRSSKFFLA